MISSSLRALGTPRGTRGIATSAAGSVTASPSRAQNRWKARMATSDRFTDAGARWALAGGLTAFALALAVLHLGAEWTSMQDRSFLGRLVLVVLLVSLAAFGDGLSPLVFVVLVTAGVLAQLLLEAFTFPTGAASVLKPPEPALESGGG